MNDQLEKRCEALRAELEALRRKMQILATDQAESKDCVVRISGRRFFKNILLTLIPLLGLVAAGGLLYGQAASEALFINPNGNVGIGTNTPRAQLDIQQGTRTSLPNHPESAKGLYITGDFGADAGIEFRHNNGTQGIGFGFNTIYATGNNANQDLNLKARGTGKVAVQGTLEGMGAVPRGAILMWSGDPAQLPAGWVLCDGASGTPDLRSRFIVGFDSRVADYNSVKKAGGLEKVALTPAELGSHAHAVRRGESAVGTHTHNWAGSSTTETGANILVYGPSTEAATPIATAAPHENRPPYLVLAYIMFTGEIKK